MVSRSFVTASARSRTDPAVGSTARTMHRPVVVFPQPLSPTSASGSLRAMSKLTSSTARTTLCTERNTPLIRSKCLLSLRT